MTYIPVDVIVDQKGKQRHRIDTLNLLAYVVLLVLVLVTTWLFKRKKRLYIHETGLAIIYGLIMGAAIRYLGFEVTVSSALLEDNVPSTVPADYVIVKARSLGDNNATQTHNYAYEFRGELQSSAKLGSQISYASVNPEVFFNIILPPIVLNAGLSLKRRHFFRNIGAIFSYAFIGTTISVAFVGSFIYGAINLIKLYFDSPYLADQFSLANCLYFGAIISPTDPLAVLAIFQELGVDVNLFALVFGESILNDAVSIVLTHSIDKFSVLYGRNPYYPVLLILWECFYNFINMFLTSCVIGIVFGIVTALTTKFSKLTETPLLETSLVVLMSYSSFLTAEAIDASGIVAILLCGITQAHYTINNLSFEARERIKNLFELLTFLCENYLFLAVGVSFWQRGQTWNLSFIGIASVAVVIARALSVYPLTSLLNLGRRNKIPCNFQHMIAWGGAARGVISYSLAARNTVGDARRIMLSTTSVIVIFSVIVVGGVAELMLKCLKIPFNREHDEEVGQDEEQLVRANNPNWLLKPRCLSSSRSKSLTQTGGSTLSFKYSRHKQPPSSVATPVLEIDTVWSGTAQHQQQPGRQSRIRRQHSYLDCVSQVSDSRVVDDFEVRSPSVSRSSGSVVVNTAVEQRFDEPLQMSSAASNSSARQVAVIEQSASASSVALAAATAATDGATGVKAVASDTCLVGTSVVCETPYENASLVKCWRNMDNNFIKPLLTNSHPTLMETLPAKLKGFARIFTSDEQLMRQPRN